MSAANCSICSIFDLASEALEQDGAATTDKGHEGVDRLVACYVRDVEDAAQLRGKVIRGELGVECAVIDASMVPGVGCLLAAAMRARAHAVSSRLVTKTVHSELLLMLSAGRQISEAFKHFGIGDTSRNLVFASFTPAGGEQAASDALAKVAADIVRKPLVAMDAIGEDINIKAICKVRVRAHFPSIGDLCDAPVYTPQRERERAQLLRGHVSRKTDDYSLSHVFDADRRHHISLCVWFTCVCVCVCVCVCTGLSLSLSLFLTINHLRILTKIHTHSTIM